jgi:hypothetical protein
VSHPRAAIDAYLQESSLQLKLADLPALGRGCALEKCDRGSLDQVGVSTEIIHDEAIPKLLEPNAKKSSNENYALEFPQIKFAGRRRADWVTVFQKTVRKNLAGQICNPARGLGSIE